MKTEEILYLQSELRKTKPALAQSESTYSNSDNLTSKYSSNTNECLTEPNSNSRNELNNQQFIANDKYNDLILVKMSYKNNNSESVKADYASNDIENLIKDRRSFYDNHKWIDDEEDDEDMICSSNTSHLTMEKNKLSEINGECNNSRKLEVTGEDDYEEDDLYNYEENAIQILTNLPEKNKILFRSEKSIRLSESSKNEIENEPNDAENGSPIKERDDFDDLVDLTHRVPKSQYKKEMNLNGMKNVTSYNHNTNINGNESNADESINRLINSKTNKLSANHNGSNPNLNSIDSEKTTSLPPLPPLPYSFVKLEKIKNSSYINGNKVNTNYFNNNTNPNNHSHFNNLNSNKDKNHNSNFISVASSTPTSPSKPLTTRLLIPLNNNNNNNNNSLNNNQTKSNTNSTSGTSNPRVISLHSTITNNNNNPNTHFNNITYSSNVINADENNQNGGYDFSQDVCTLKFNSKKQTTPLVTSSFSTTINNEPTNDDLSQLVKNHSNTQKFNSNSANRDISLNLTSNDYSDNQDTSSSQSDRSSKSSDVSQEWDQISKIFASLETMLNEVVETTSKNLEILNVNHNTFNNNAEAKVSSQTQANNSNESSSSPSSMSSCSSPSISKISFKNEEQNHNKTNNHISEYDERISKDISDQLMSNIDDNINNHLKHIEICKFLRKINLAKYEFKFITNGYDDITFMNNVLTLQDLIQIGIDNYDDIFKILKEVKSLPTAINLILEEGITFKSIEEWLDFLNLTEYLGNFRVAGINTIKRIETLWEIELTTVLQIPFFGHRKRIMASIGAIMKSQNGTLKKQTNTNSRAEEEKDDYSEKSKTIKEHEIDLKIDENDLCSSSSINNSSTLRNNDSSHRRLNITSSASSLNPAKTVKFLDDIRNKECCLNMNLKENNNHCINTHLIAEKLSKTKNSQLNTLKNFLKTTSPKLTRSNSSLTREDKRNKNEFQFLFKKRNCSAECKTNERSLSPKRDTLQNSYLNKENTSESDFSTVLNDSTRCPKQIWKNDPQNFIRGSYNFIVQYLGSSALTKLKSNQDPVKYTIDRLKNTSRSTPYQSPKVELSISINGVKMLHSKTKELLWNHDIKHINNVCQDQDDLNYFAFSTQTDQNAHYYCHVFSCKDKELSTQIILTIGQAFDIAYELFCKNNVI